MKRLVAAALMALSGAASAQHFYIHGALGQAHVEGGKAGLDARLSAAGAAGLSSSMDTKDLGYKLQLGYMFNETYGIEGGYVSLGNWNYRAAYTGGNASADVKATGFNIAGIGHYPFGRITMFGRLGVMVANIDATVLATGPGGTASGASGGTSWTPNYGFGLTYEVLRDIYLRGEWERFHKIGDKNSTGESNVNLLSVGLMYIFR